MSARARLETERWLTADVRLGPYAVLGALGSVAALVTGSPLFLALAAPALVVLSIAARPVPRIEVAVGDVPRRALEGDRWPVRLELRWPGDEGAALELDWLVEAGAGLEVVGDAGAAIVGVGGASVDFEVAAVRWGRHGLGRLALRARRPDGVLVRDLVVELGPEVRVLPTSSRLDALVHPVRPQATAGVHAAPTRGPGTDFADLRPYSAGDRLRDLSWSASARSEQPWVVLHHPERSGTVILLLDGFGEVGVPAAALDRAARIVWSLARHHLVNGDRVGLSGSGPTVAWLAPVAGRRSRWLVLDALMDAGRPSLPRDRAVPPGLPGDAFVVGVSPLQSDAFVAAVAHHRRRGRATAVVGVETSDLLPPPPAGAAGDVERAARRLWDADREVRIAALADAGVRTVVVGDDATPAVRSLSRDRPTSRTVRSRVRSTVAS